MSDKPEDIVEDTTIAEVLGKYNLKDKRASFVREYMVDENATRAAIRAGYSENSAKQQGSRLLTNADIALVISKCKTARALKLDFGKEDLIAYRIETLRSRKTTRAEKNAAATALERIWGLHKNELNINLTGNLAERMANARRRRKP